MNMLTSEIADTIGVNIKWPVIRNKKDKTIDKGMSIKPTSGVTNKFDMGEIIAK